MNIDGEKHELDFEWNHPLCIRTDVLGLQPGRAAGGWRCKGYCIGGEEGQQGKLNKNVGCQGIQDERGRSWMMRMFWDELVVWEVA